MGSYLEMGTSKSGSPDYFAGAVTLKKMAVGPEEQYRG